MSDPLSALSVLTVLLDARRTSSRLSHIQSISQLSMIEFDSILYQLINLSTLFQHSNLIKEQHSLNQTIESMCASSAHLAIKCKWLCDAVAATFRQPTKPKDQAINSAIYHSLDRLSKSVEAAFVNGKYVKASLLQSMIPDHHSVSETISIQCQCAVDSQGDVSVTIEPATECLIETNDSHINQQSISSPTSLSSSRLVDVDADVMFALSKKQRNDYFDSINTLIYEFNEAGQTLIEQPLDQRQAVLKKLMQSVNHSAKRLYIPAQPAVTVKERIKRSASSVNQSSFQTPPLSTRTSVKQPTSKSINHTDDHSINEPMLRTAPLPISLSFDATTANSSLDHSFNRSSGQSTSDLPSNSLITRATQSINQPIVQSILPITRHYVIDRIIASQSISLSSKARAPFLVLAEIHYTGKDVYDPLIYESIQPVHQSNNLLAELDQTASQPFSSSVTEPDLPVSPSQSKLVSTDSSPERLSVLTLTPPGSIRPRSRSEAVNGNQSSNQSLNQSARLPTREQSLNETQPANSRSRIPRHPTAPSSPSPLIQSKITRRQSDLDQVDHSVKRTSKQSTIDYLRSLPFSVLDAAFGPQWQQRKQQIRQRSKYANQSIDQSVSQSDDPPHEWDLTSFLIKGQDPAIAQELLASQLINVCRSIFGQSNSQSTSKSANPSIFLAPLSITLSGPDSAIVEALVDASSIDSIKRKLNIQSLRDFFVAYFSHSQHPSNNQSTNQSIYPVALSNYLSSMVGYSLLTYVLSVRDRHNGNIMLTRSGHIVHIDFGFLLGNSPGRNMNFESCPFKMTDEYWHLLTPTGSPDAALAMKFSNMFEAGFMALRARFTELIALIRPLANTRLPCFEVNTVADAIAGIRTRLCVDSSEADARMRARACVNESVGNWRSQQYDLLQYYSNSIR